MQVSRESIFSSSIRAFCKAFCSIFGFLLAVFAIFMVIGAASGKGEGTFPKTETQIMPDADGTRKMLGMDTPVILHINIEGVIGLKKLKSKWVELQLLDSRIGLYDKDRVKGIMLHINTPGGTVEDSDAIYRALLAYKAKYNVPVYAYVSGMCASGGMYIASACDKINSSPVAVIGSVGVRLGPMFNYYDIMDEHGIKARTFTAGIGKDDMNPFRQWKADEGEERETIIKYNYERFINVVTKGRPKMDRDELIKKYGAKVFDPVQALEYGYIDDGNSSYNETLKALVKAAGIDDKYQVVQLKVQRQMFQELLSAQSALFKGKIEHTFNMHPTCPPEFAGKLLYLHM